MADSLEERLKDHAKAFDGLLSLIPAKLYYGEDTDNQWNRKKQTKEEARAAKRAKLDPENTKSAKDVMEENARKRKREEEGDISDFEGIEAELPKEGMKPLGKKSKKDKKWVPKDAEESAVDIPKTKAEKRRAKRERKQVEKAQSKEKRKEKKESKRQPKALSPEGETEENSDEESIAVSENGKIQFNMANSTDLQDPPIQVKSPSSTDSVSAEESTGFDHIVTQSGTSSISSIVENPGTLIGPRKDMPAPPTRVSSSEARARLQQRIEALRNARKADKDDGTPARTRQELIESRRRKEEQRKAHKKQLRQQAKEEEKRQKENALANGSPLLSPSIMSPHGSHGQSPLSEPSNNFSYGRISFDNGQAMTANLDSVLDPHKKKGPQDAYTALEAAKNRETRLSGLDANKRADIEEKDLWLNARKRAQGERVNAEGSLLKKALKRKEKQKKKSEKEWSERIQGVAKGQAMRQQKREENLRKRKEEKGSKGGKSKGVKSKPKARPGFEGSFRAGGKRK